MTTVGIATGAGRGMGRACAERLADIVDRLLLIDLDDASVTAAAHELGSQIEDPGIAYAWAKRGVQRFAQQEAVRVGPMGGRVCSVSPGSIDTPQGRQEAASQPFMAELLRRTPLGRLGQADEVADVVAFVLSDEASFVTGVDVLVDGGVCAAILGPSSQP